MSVESKDRGEFLEKVVEKFLIQEGCEVTCYNKNGWHEVDFGIKMPNGKVSYVEVKYKKKPAWDGKYYGVDVNKHTSYVKKISRDGDDINIIFYDESKRICFHEWYTKLACIENNVKKGERADGKSFTVKAFYPKDLRVSERLSEFINDEFDIKYNNDIKRCESLDDLFSSKKKVFDEKTGQYILPLDIEDKDIRQHYEW